MKRLIVVIFCLFISIQSFTKELIITYRAPSSELDVRFKYPLELVTTAMEKTKAEYGEYKTVAAPIMNLKRATAPEFIGQLENFIFETSATKTNDKNLLPIKIPISKGLFGYRIFLIDKKNQEKFSKINTLAELKKLRIGQGAGWADVSILEEGGFTVIQGANYEGLFRMLTTGRFEVFSRGVTEAYSEKDARADEIPSLAVEKDICLYYPLPRYFYTAKENTLFAERLTKGLEIMIDDGTFDKIWRKYYSEILNKADLKNRKIFKIDNPFAPDDVPFDNPKYWYTPE